MAVDLHIGSIETVIETSGMPDDRRALVAEVLRLLRADLARTEAEAASRARDATAPPRAFGRRF